jgi:methionine synthase II (cobalamin-independent)
LAALIARKLSLAPSISVPSYIYLKGELVIPEAKVWIPSPTMLQFGGGKIPKFPKEAYPDGNQFGSSFFKDLAPCYGQEIKELYRAGCRYVQLDETSIALICDPKFETTY